MTNSHDDLHKIVTQAAKDRTVTGTVTAQQTVAGDLKATVTQLEKDRTVTNAVAANLKAEVSGTVNIGEATVIQPDPADLKATVTQAAKDRTVTNAVAANLKATVTQLAKDRTVTNPTAANLKAEVTQASAARTVSGNVTTNKGEPNYTEIVKHGDYSSAMTNEDLWTPAGGKKFVVTDIIISCDEACNFTLLDEAAPKFVLFFDAKGGCVMNLQTPWKSTTADNDLKVTTTEAVDHTITVLGYEV